MKHVILILAVIFGLLACEGPMGPQGPKGDPGEGTYWYVEDILVKASEWQLIQDQNGLNRKFLCEKNISALTDDIYYDGDVDVYIYFNFDTNNELQRKLPYVLPAEDGRTPNWIEVYDYDIAPGSIGFYLTYSDFNTSYRPGDTYFRIVLKGW